MLLVFLLETMQVWLQWNIIIKVVEKKKKPSSWNPIASKNVFQKQRWNKDVFRHTQAKGFFTSSYALKEILKEVLWLEGKWFQMDLQKEEHQKW